MGQSRVRKRYFPAASENATVHCKLFSDTVTVHLCAVRRKELDLDQAFSCSGCTFAAMIPGKTNEWREARGAN